MRDPGHNACHVAEPNGRTLTSNTRVSGSCLRHCRSFQSFGGLGNSSSARAAISNNLRGGDRTCSSRRAPSRTLSHTFSSVGVQLTSSLLSRILGLSPVTFRQFILSLVTGVKCKTFSSTDRVAPVSKSRNVSKVVVRSGLNFSLVCIRTGHCTRSGSINEPSVRTFMNTVAKHKNGKLFIAATEFARGTVACTGERRVVLVSKRGLTRLVVRRKFNIDAQGVCRVGTISDSIFGRCISRRW